MRLLLILLLILVPSLCWANPIIGAFMDVGGGVSVTAPGDPPSFCSSQSWATYTDFKIDFDHTTDEKYACLDSGTETGTLDGATIASHTITNPGSGGNTLFGDATNDSIEFHNTGSYFNSAYGSFRCLINIDGENNTDYIFAYIIPVDYDNRLRLSIGANGLLQVLWEDHNGGIINTYVNATDFENHPGDWGQIEVKWDTTACTAGDGNCGETNEIGARVRVDDNRDGDFDDGGAEDWTDWSYESSTQDLNAWAVEPSTEDIVFGLGGTHNVDFNMDDIEISNSKPSTMGN